MNTTSNLLVFHFAPNASPAVWIWINIDPIKQGNTFYQYYQGEVTLYGEHFDKFKIFPN
jgi:hypothetical protein